MTILPRLVTATVLIAAGIALSPWPRRWSQNQLVIAWAVVAGAVVGLAAVWPVGHL